MIGSLLTVKNLHVVFDTPHGESCVLRGVDFAVRQGSIFGIVGESGCGKSLTGKAILDLLPNAGRVTDGRILFNGRDLRQMSKRERRGLLGKQIGMIFQDHRLLTDRTVLDNVAMPLVIRGARRGEVKRRARAALDKVGLLNKERAMPSTLSGGEQQRVGIARAIVSKPPIILADEPTGNLDPELSLDIMQLFCQLNASGMCLLIASHDLALVRGLGRRVLVLHEGQLIDDYQPSTLA